MKSLSLNRIFINTTFLILSLFTANSPAAISRAWAPYSSSMSAGATCTVEVQRLHPTQCAVGYWEIEQRSKKVLQKDNKKLSKYMQEHIGKIVVGPEGEPYIIDRHHLACIMERTGKSRTILAVVEANFSSLSIDSFWNEMKIHNWVYLYDENGNGPIEPGALPESIKDLKDDPFRSLAWAVREAGGYEQTEDPFAEFTWADYFRRNLSAENTNKNMNQLIQQALILCHKSSARDLPGYVDINKSSGN